MQNLNANIGNSNSKEGKEKSMIPLNVYGVCTTRSWISWYNQEVSAGFCWAKTRPQPTTYIPSTPIQDKENRIYSQHFWPTPAWRGDSRSKKSVRIDSNGLEFVCDMLTNWNDWLNSHGIKADILLRLCAFYSFDILNRFGTELNLCKNVNSE